MLILNTNVTFKYECYLFFEQTARHTSGSNWYDLGQKAMAVNF